MTRYFHAASLARFRVHGRYYVVLERSDGEVLLRTAPLRGQLACRSTILSIRLNSLLDECYVRSGDDTGCYGFELRVPDGELLATSPIYGSARDRDRAIEAVRRGAPGAFVIHAAEDEEEPTDPPPDGVVVVQAQKPAGADDNGQPTGGSQSGPA